MVSGPTILPKQSFTPDDTQNCILCPNEGGAFKQTVSGEWVHLLCAIWIPETSVANEVFMEPITGVEKISKQRWRLVSKTYLSSLILNLDVLEVFHMRYQRRRLRTMYQGVVFYRVPRNMCQEGEVPHADESNARLRSSNVSVLLRETPAGTPSGPSFVYPRRLTPRQQREQQEVRATMRRNDPYDGADGDNIHPSPKSNKTMRAYNKQYKPGPPLVPKIIVNRILQYISKIHLRHKPDFVHLVCRYWSLKREARRGAPLLKRLHLEPWTALSGSKQQTDEEKALKLDVSYHARF